MINRDLLLSILAMDSYNRGYGPGISDGVNVVDSTDQDALGGVGSIVGNATIIAEPVVTDGSDAVENGFYAAAYQVGEEIIIAYRGTDDPLDADAWNDFQLVTASFGVPEQARLAAEFYQEVKAANEGKQITVTGHSLGGALSGVVSRLYGSDDVFKEAVLFNNISFEGISNRIYEIATRTDEEIELMVSTESDNPIFQQTLRETLENERAKILSDFYPDQLPKPINNNNRKTLELLGDVADNTRTNIFQSETPQISIGSQTLDQNLEAIPRNAVDDILSIAGRLIGGDDIAINLHFQALVVLKKFSEDFGHDPAFTNVYSEIIDSFYTPYIAQEIGVLDDNGLGDIGLIQKQISYSAIEDGELVFGDSGIRTLFDDVENLGKVFDENINEVRDLFLDDTKIVAVARDLTAEAEVFISLKQALADITVQYAGALALNKVEKQDVLNNDDLGFDPTEGVFALSNDDSVLALDLSSVLWQDVLNASKGTDDTTLENPLDPIHKVQLLNAFFRQSDSLVSWWDLFFGGYDEDRLDELAQDVWGGEDRSIFDRIHIRTQNTSITNASGREVVRVDLPDRAYDTSITFGEGVHVDVYVGDQDKDNFVLDSKGNDFVIGGSGRDTLLTSGGNDIIFGNAGSDMVVNFRTRLDPADTASLGVDPVTTGSTIIGKETEQDASLLDVFFRWWEGDRTDENLEEDIYSFSRASIDETAVENGFKVTRLELDTSGDREEIKLTTREFGSSDNPEITDTLIGIDRTKFTWRRDVVNVTDASLQAPILLDLGGFAPDEVLESDFDEVDYSQLSRGITYVNGTTRFADEGDEGRNSSLGVSDLLPYLFGATPDFLSFGDQRENDALRVTGAENITATDHDDTLWFGQVGLLQSLLSGWPADLGASPFGTIDAGDGNDLIAFTGADVVFADDLIPEEYGGEAQTPNPETGELEGGSIAAEQLRVTIDGGKGDDYILTRGGTGAITVGGEGRDFIFNTSAFGQIYGDTLDGLDSEGNPLDHTGSENADTFWFWPGTFIQDAQPNDRLTLFGLPLVGGSNAVGGVAAGDGSLALDFFNFGTVYGSTFSGQLLIINRFLQEFGTGPEGLEGVQVVEDYDFGGFSDETYGRAAPGDLGLTFRIFLPADRALEGVVISLFNAVWGSVFAIIDAAEQLAKLNLFFFIPPQPSRKYCN